MYISSTTSRGLRPNYNFFKKEGGHRVIFKPKFGSKVERCATGACPSAVRIVRQPRLVSQCSACEINALTSSILTALAASRFSARTITAAAQCAAAKLEPSLHITTPKTHAMLRRPAIVFSTLCYASRMPVFALALAVLLFVSCLPPAAAQPPLSSPLCASASTVSGR